jgi:hypothetical protein
MRSDLLWRAFAVLCILLNVAVCVGIGFVAWHFIAKFW